jgi:hypothetical protein
MVRSNLPPPDRLFYYGGLAALAAIGVVDWPVAAAVGAGVWIATRAGERGDGKGLPDTTKSSPEPTKTGGTDAPETRPEAARVTQRAGRGAGRSPSGAAKAQ